MIKYVNASLTTISRNNQPSGKLDNVWFVTKFENASDVSGWKKFDSFDEAVRFANLLLANGNDIYIENGKTLKWQRVSPEDFEGEIPYGFDDDCVGAFPYKKESFM